MASNLGICGTLSFNNTLRWLLLVSPGDADSSFGELVVVSPVSGIRFGE